MSKIYKITPLFAERIWGGHKLKDTFGYQFDQDPVGEGWLVGNVPLGTNIVEGVNLPIDEFYRQYRQEYFGINEEKFPLRCTLIDPIDNLSVQLHPSDEYALKHDNSRGKPEAWYVIDAAPGTKIQFGHSAKTKDEFVEMANAGRWDDLLCYVDAINEEFLYVDYGVLHAVGKDVLCYEVARNADITYRVYDYNRLDKKTGKLRDLHLAKALDNIKAPHLEQGPIKPTEKWQDGVGVIEYHNQPGEFIFRRIRCHDQGVYQQNEFGFYTVARGSGKINDIDVKIGDTYFIPKDAGSFTIAGDIDLLMSSYSDK